MITTRLNTLYDSMRVAYLLFKRIDMQDIIGQLDDILSSRNGENNYSENEKATFAEIMNAEMLLLDCKEKKKKQRKYFALLEKVKRYHSV